MESAVSSQFCSVPFCSVEGGGTGRKRRVGGQVQERDGERRGEERRVVVTCHWWYLSTSLPLSISIIPSRMSINAMTAPHLIPSDPQQCWALCSADSPCYVAMRTTCYKTHVILHTTQHYILFYYIAYLQGIREHVLVIP